MVVHSFFMGIATVLFETAASATFLSRFAARDLPWVYIASAVLNTATGLVYVRLQTRVRFASLMKGTLWALLALVVAIRFGQAASGAAWVAFGALVAYRIVSSLTDLEYWAVAGRVYDIGQARRLFGVVGTGEVVARAAGAFCVPLLVATGGVSNLMVWSAGALACCIIVLGRILEHDHGPILSRRTAEAHLRGAFDNDYLRIVVAVAVLATFGKFFVDFSYLESIGSLGRSERELATLLGILSGVAQVASLLLRLFVSRPLLGRIGIRNGVLVLPLAHALCTLLVIGSGMLGSYGAMFGFVLLNQGLYKALKHPIDNASFKVLYQPLSAAQRLAAQISVEVLFTPIVVAIAGGLMLVFTSHWNPVRFSRLLLAVFAVWIVLARVAGRKYEGMLDLVLRSATSRPPHERAAIECELRDVQSRTKRDR